MSKDPTIPSRGPGDVKRIANRDIDELARFVRDGNFSYRVFAAEPSEGHSGRSLASDQAPYAAETRFSEDDRGMPTGVAGAAAAAATKPLPSAEPLPVPVVDVNVPRGQLPHITFASAPAVAPPAPPALAQPPRPPSPEATPVPRARRKAASTRGSMPSVREVLWRKSEPPPKPAPRPLLAGTVFTESPAGEVSLPPAAGSVARTPAARPDFSGTRSVEQVLGSLMHPLPPPVAPSTKGSAGAVVEALFEYRRIR